MPRDVAGSRSPQQRLRRTQTFAEVLGQRLVDRSHVPGRGSPSAQLGQHAIRAKAAACLKRHQVGSVGRTIARQATQPSAVTCETITPHARRQGPRRTDRTLYRRHETATERRVRARRPHHASGRDRAPRRGAARPGPSAGDALQRAAQPRTHHHEHQRRAASRRDPRDRLSRLPRHHPVRPHRFLADRRVRGDSVRALGPNRGANRAPQTRLRRSPRRQQPGVDPPDGSAAHHPSRRG